MMRQRQQQPIFEKKIKLFKIAIAMIREKLPNTFIVHAVETAYEFEGVANLLKLWAEEENRKEKDEIISDIQEMIDACDSSEKLHEIHVKLNDLNAIANNIRAFKDGLYQKVIERGGISKLAELTGIPQPSLSRFFNSNTMPQRATVFKISKALNLNEIKIDTFWWSNK